jgi:hypothetical protein
MSGGAQPAAVQPGPRIARAARLRHIEALARRAQQHEGPARSLMDARLQQLRDALAAESEPGPPTPAAGPQSSPLTLVQLLAHIKGAAAPAAAPELKAISQYRSTWSRLSAEHRLHQALAAMRDASPHYLHRFMVQVETLLWLEQLAQGVGPVAEKKPAARKTRA